MNSPRWQDAIVGYGRISRLLHWGMAALLLWQFTSALLHQFTPDTTVADFFWSTHFSVGFTLWVLVLVRASWSFANLRKRPPRRGSPLLRQASVVGHLAMYALMIVVPTIAILRAVYNGRGFITYGISLVSAGGSPNTLLVTPANVAHASLGWALLALVIGHVGVALWHGCIRKNGTLDRMTKGRAA